MEVLGHDDVAEHDETVALAGLFEDFEEEIAAGCAAQRGPALVATAGNEVQVSCAVVSL